MSESIHPVPAHFASDIGPQELKRLHETAARDPDAFWLDQAQRLDWSRFPNQAGDSSFHEADFRIRWYADGELNLSVNCLDRHLATRGDRTALIFEADEPGQGRTLTCRELYEETCRFANLLKQRGVGRGDRVMIYMPMIPEAAAAMLACARIGAIHSVVFGRFLTRQPGGPDRGLRRQLRHHRGRGAARGQGDPAQGQCRQGACAARRCNGYRRDPHRHGRSHEGRARYRLFCRSRRTRHRMRT
jgi:non-ribosomal peptide synthetase component F